MVEGEEEEHEMPSIAEGEVGEVEVEGTGVTGGEDREGEEAVLGEEGEE